MMLRLDGRRDFMSAMADPEAQKDKYEGNPYCDKILGRAFSAYSCQSWFKSGISV